MSSNLLANTGLIIGIICPVIFLLLIIIGFIISMKAKHDERKKVFNDVMEDLNKYIEMSPEEREKVQQEKHNRTTIKKAVIIGHDTNKDATSAALRGAVGGALLGVGGAIGGALSGKNNNTTTFLLIFLDDHRETVEVENGSDQYNYYIQFLEV